MPPTRIQGDSTVVEDSTPTMVPTTPATPATPAMPAPATGSKPEPVVKYVGPAMRRVLTEKDWAKVGAEGQGYAEWNVVNSRQLPVSQFSPAALAYLRDKDDRFIIVDQ